MEENKKNKDTGMGQEGNQNWDEQNDERSGASRQPNPERLDTEETQAGQEGNQNWDDENDKNSERTHKPNPERFEGGSGFNEKPQTTGHGSSQQGEERGENQTGPGLG